MASPYAFLEDLAAYLGSEPPAGAQRLLARAQDLVDAKLIGVVYATDDNGNATDATVVAPALKQAVCAQVEWWLSSGDEFDAVGDWTSYSIAGVSVTRMPASNPSRLCPRAWDVLRVAGLVAAQTPVKIP